MPTAITANHPPGSWTVAAAMGRGGSYGSTATVLNDGRVLVAGGEGDSAYATKSAALYDPVADRWTDTGGMLARRRGHAATLLPDGRVLVAGGWSLNDPDGPPRFAELFDPKIGTWSKAGSMTRWRYAPIAVALRDGRVLVIGGFIDAGGVTKGGEIYDPATSTWRWIRSMSSPPSAAAVMADGRVLVLHAGRAGEVFDPVSGRWTAISDPPDGDGWDEVVRLAGGDMLVLDARRPAAEIYHPSTDTWTATGAPETGRGLATVLGDGSVLVTGIGSSARYDPTAGSWTVIARPPLPRDYAMESPLGVEVNLAVELHDGRLFASQFGAVALFDPASG